MLDFLLSNLSFLAVRCVSFLATDLVLLRGMTEPVISILSSCFWLVLGKFTVSIWRTFCESFELFLDKLSTSFLNSAT